MREWGKSLPPNWRGQQVNAETHNSLEKNPPWELIWSKNIWTVIDGLLEAQCEQICELRTPGHPGLDACRAGGIPTLSGVLPPGAQLGSHSEYWSKNSLMHPRICSWASIAYFSASIWSETVLNPLVQARGFHSRWTGLSATGGMFSSLLQPSACFQPFGPPGPLLSLSLILCLSSR